MSLKSCLFPEHHGSGDGPISVVAVVVVAAIIAFMVRFERDIEHAFGIVAAVVPYLVFGLAAIIAARLLLGVVRFTRAPLEVKRNYPLALLARWRWRWLCRNLNLAYIDRHKKASRPVAFGTAAKVRPDAPEKTKMRFPRAKVRPTTHGIEAAVRTVPGVGRAEFEDQAEHLANQWRCERVSVTQPVSGRLIVRGLRHDPLLDPFGPELAPAGTYDGQDLTRLYVGRDEHGQHRHMQVKDNTAATVAGQPGSGKSVGINGLLMQWAPSPACQFGTADGKSPVDGGDYEVWRPRAWRTCSDSREDTADMLSDACKIMRVRLGCVAGADRQPERLASGPDPGLPALRPGPR